MFSVNNRKEIDMPEDYPKLGKFFQTPTTRNDFNRQDVKFIDLVSQSVNKVSERPSSIFGYYTRTKQPWNVQSFGSDYYFMSRNSRVSINYTDMGSTYGTDSCRGWNATPSSMTKFDLLMLRCLDQASIILGIKDKDWNDTQRANLVAKIFADWLILHALRNQYKYFHLFLNPEEDSAQTNDNEIVWDWQDLLSITSNIMTRKYPIFNVSYQLARLTSPLFELQPGYPQKGYPPMYYQPYDMIKCDDTPSKFTTTNFNLLFSYARTLTEAIIHAAKVNLPWTPISEQMLTYETFGIQSPLAWLYTVGSHVGYYDAASNQTFTNQTFASANHASKVYPIEANGRLHEIFAFMPIIADTYDATNNPYCINTASISTTTEDYANITRMAYDDTVMTTSSPFTHLYSCAPMLLDCLMPSMILTGAGNATQGGNPKYLAAILFPGTLSVTGITQNTLENALEAKLIKLIIGGDLLANNEGTQRMAKRQSRGRKDDS